MTDETYKQSRPVYWVWLAVFFIGSIGAGVFARVMDFGPFWSMAIMVPPMALLFPLIRAVERSQKAANGRVSMAIVRYNRRILIWTFSYMAALFTAVSVFNSFAPDGPVLWIIAILPALPIIYFVWVMAQYLAEETDEYQRMRQITSALFATGLLLVVATIWGFLETFGIAPHVPSWAAVPVWAMGLGLAQIGAAIRGA